MKNAFTYILLLVITATVILIFPFFGDFKSDLQNRFNEKKSNVVTEYERVKGKIIEVNDKVQSTKDSIEKTIDNVNDVMDTAGNLIDKVNGIVDIEESESILLVYDEDRNFSEEEVAQIEDRVISPFVLYYSESEQPVVKMQISKADDAPDTLSAYSFSYSRDAENMEIGGSFGLSPVKTQSETIEDYLTWCPSCFYLDCRDIPDVFREEYPDINEMALNGCLAK